LEGADFSKELEELACSLALVFCSGYFRGVPIRSDLREVGGEI